MKYFLTRNDFFIISFVALIAAMMRWQIDQLFYVNIIGCFLLGIINALSISQRFKSIIGLGFCGSLTTFSGFSFHLFKLINQGFYVLFLRDAILFIGLGFFAVVLGNLFARKILN